MMAMGVYGDRQTAANLRRLANRFPLSALDRAAVKSMSPMLDETRQAYRAHRQPQTADGDHLDQNIVVRKESGSRTRRNYKLGANRNAQWKAHLAEFGTAAHYQPKRGVLHPGARPILAMTHAYEQHGNDVIRSLGKGLRRILDQLALSSIVRRSRR